VGVCLRKTGVSVFLTRREIFNNVRERWPSQIRMVGINSSQSAVLTTPPLFEVYKTISGQLAPDDNWAELAAWSFHQALDKLGRRKFRQRQTVLHPHDVSFQSFNTMMISNLSHEDWESERAHYMKMS
jgi:hypothetical protein